MAAMGGAGYAPNAIPVLPAPTPPLLVPAVNIKTQGDDFYDWYLHTPTATGVQANFSIIPGPGVDKEPLVGIPLSTFLNEFGLLIPGRPPIRPYFAVDLNGTRKSGYIVAPAETQSFTLDDAVNDFTFKMTYRYAQDYGTVVVVMSIKPGPSWLGTENPGEIPYCFRAVTVTGPASLAADIQGNTLDGIVFQETNQDPGVSSMKKTKARK